MKNILTTFGMILSGWIGLSFIQIYFEIAMDSLTFNFFYHLVKIIEIIS